MRISWVAMFLLMFTGVLTAQETKTWCAIEPPDRTNTGYISTAERLQQYPQILEILDLPDERLINSFLGSAITVSENGLAAVQLWDTVIDYPDVPETVTIDIVLLDLEAETILRRITSSELAALLPVQLDDTQGIEITGARWVGDGDQLLFRVSEICLLCSENFSGRRDNWHILERDGTIRTLITGSTEDYQPVLASVTPDNHHLLLATLDSVGIMNLDGEWLGEDLIPQYMSQVQPYGTPVLHIIWEDDNSAIIMSDAAETFNHQGTITEIEVWRVFIDGQSAQLLQTVTGIYTSAALSPDGDYIAYIVTEEIFNQDNITATVTHIETGNTWVFGHSLYMRWRVYEDQSVLYYPDADEGSLYFSLCTV